MASAKSKITSSLTHTAELLRLVREGDKAEGTQGLDDIIEQLLSVKGAGGKQVGLSRR